MSCVGVAGNVRGRRKIPATGHVTGDLAQPAGPGVAAGHVVGGLAQAAGPGVAAGPIGAR